MIYYLYIASICISTHKRFAEPEAVGAPRHRNHCDSPHLVEGVVGVVDVPGALIWCHRCVLFYGIFSSPVWSD
jgi:hypothetical protein